MIAEKEQYTCAQITIQLPERASAAKPALQPSFVFAQNGNDIPLFEFAANAPATLAERHPHLMVFAISAAVLLAAITAEVECLTHSGYFWR